MAVSEIFVFVIGYLAVSTVLLACLLPRHRTFSLVSVVLVILACLVGATILAPTLNDGTELRELMVDAVVGRDMRAMVAVWAGVLAALPGLLACTLRERPKRRLASWSAVVWFSIAAGGAGVTLSLGLLAWDTVFDIQMTPARVLDERFVVEEFGELSENPIRVASETGTTVFVSSTSVTLAGQHSGTITRIESDLDGVPRASVAAASPALYRPYGLCVEGNTLYVSRSGHIAHAENGEFRQLPGGAVTQLKDLDGDGYYEYYHDVVRGLPGAGFPDTMHQNNGIAFDSHGNLYVANGAKGDRDLDEHPWGGTVLKVDPGFEHVSVFARGFRNPFGITVGSNDTVFVTDNDTSDDTGDELNHVIQGEHYGHPYVVTNEVGRRAKGFRGPIFLAPHGNLTGLVYTEDESLPPEYRGCIYCCDRLGNRVLRIALRRKGDTYEAVSVTPFAVVQSPVDIAVAPGGVFFVASYTYRTIYRISYKRARRHDAG